MKINNSNSNQNTYNKHQEIRINNQYSFKSNNELESGSFGQIFKGRNLKTREEIAEKIFYQQKQKLLNYFMNIKY